MNREARGQLLKNKASHGALVVPFPVPSGPVSRGMFVVREMQVYVFSSGNRRKRVRLISKRDVSERNGEAWESITHVAHSIF